MQDTYETATSPPATTTTTVKVSTTTAPTRRPLRTRTVYDRRKPYSSGAAKIRARLKALRHRPSTPTTNKSRRRTTTTTSTEVPRSTITTTRPTTITTRTLAPRRYTTSRPTPVIYRRPISRYTTTTENPRSDVEELKTNLLEQFPQSVPQYSDKKKKKTNIHPVFDRIRLPDESFESPKKRTKSKEYTSSDDIREEDYPVYDELYDPAPVGPRYTTRANKILSNNNSHHLPYQEISRNKLDLTKEDDDSVDEFLSNKVSERYRNSGGEVETSGKTLRQFSHPLPRPVILPPPRSPHPSSHLPNPRLVLPPIAGIENFPFIHPKDGNPPPRSPLVPRPVPLVDLPPVYDIRNRKPQLNPVPLQHHDVSFPTSTELQRFHPSEGIPDSFYKPSFDYELSEEEPPIYTHTENSIHEYNIHDNELSSEYDDIDQVGYLYCY